MNATICSAQNVRISQPAASLAARALAMMIDSTLVAVVFGLVLIFMLSFRERFLSAHPVSAQVLTILVLLNVLLLPFWQEVCFNGCTLGKRLLHLRVVQTDGSAPTLLSLFVRFLLLPVELGAGGLGLLLTIFHPQHRRLGDLAARTLVARTHTYHSLRPALSILEEAPEDWSPRYPKAVHLTPRQVRIIEQVLRRGKYAEGFPPLALLLPRVEAIVGEKPAQVGTAKFLSDVLYDYHHLS